MKLSRNFVETFGETLFMLQTQEACIHVSDIYTGKGPSPPPISRELHYLDKRLVQKYWLLTSGVGMHYLLEGSFGGKGG